MKHKTILFVSVLAVAGALVLAVNTNNHALQSAKVHAAAVSKQVKQNLATRKKLQGQVQTQTLEITNLQSQCQVGVKDYHLLTTAQRLQAAVPKCELQPAAPVQ